MQLIPVQSSQIAAIGHDPATKKLHVQFHPRKGSEEPGKVYEYDDIDADKHQALMSAQSIYSHFYGQIKHNPAHPFRKLS